MRRYAAISIRLVHRLWLDDLTVFTFDVSFADCQNEAWIGRRQLGLRGDMSAMSGLAIQEQHRRAEDLRSLDGGVCSID